MTPRARLMIAASEYDADMLYASGLFTPDAFIAVELDGAWHGLLSPLEVDRARRHSRLAAVHLDTTWRKKAREQTGCDRLADVAAAFLRAHGVRAVTVPAGFALAHAERLRALGFEVVPCDGAMFPERAVKTAWEIAQLRKAERLTRRAMHAARSFLARAGVGNDGVLRCPDTGRRMKSAHVRQVIETFLIAHGATPSHTIVACGRESADPHQEGRGLIRAGVPVIIDIFPRLGASGYWGDMTRTFVKGRASDALKRMYRAVREGQDLGLSMVRDGAHGAEIHAAIQRHFEACGFVTGMRHGRQVGFFHGTGHGVGLDVHEAPRISVRDDVLRAGHVVTVEPGLYYPRPGGVRLEDLVLVTADGCDNLTRYPRRLEIP